MTQTNERDGVARVRRQILDEASPGFLEVYGQLRKLINDDARSIILRRYDMGGIVSKMSKDTATYGNQSVERMARLFSSDSSMLSRCKLIYERFTSDEIAAVTTTPNANGDLLTYSHVALLSQIAAASTRNRFLRACLDNSWTYVELEAAVRERLPSTGIGGRKYKVPATLDGYLANVSSVAEEVAARAAKVWTDADHGLIACFRGVDPTQLTDEQMTKIRRTRDEIDSALAALKRLRADFDTMDDVIDDVLESRDVDDGDVVPPAAPPAVRRDRSRRQVAKV